MTAIFALPRYVPLLLAFLLVRALSPVGWMPVAQDGAIVWQLCPGLVSSPEPQAQMQMHAMGGHAEHSHHGDHEKTGAKDPCPFGALSSGNAAPVDPPLITDVLPIAPMAPVAAEDLGLAQLRWLAHAYARGPPRFA